MLETECQFHVCRLGVSLSEFVNVQLVEGCVRLERMFDELFALDCRLAQERVEREVIVVKLDLQSRVVVLANLVTVVNVKVDLFVGKVWREGRILDRLCPLPGSILWTSDAKPKERVCAVVLQRASADKERSDEQNVVSYVGYVVCGGA